MNVTIEIPDELCFAALERANEAGLSLPDWIARLLSKELAKGPAKFSRTMLEALGNDELVLIPLEIDRLETPSRGGFEIDESTKSFMEQRSLLPGYAAALEAGAFAGVTDATVIVSEDRSSRDDSMAQ